MSTKQVLFLFFLGTLIFSCEDEVDLLTFPSVYHKSGYEVMYVNVRVFASTGEIKNSSVINRFSQRDSSMFAYFTGLIRNNQGIMDRIEFIDSEHARLNHWDFTHTDCSLTIQGDLIILIKNEVTRECCFYMEEYSHSIPYYMSAVKPEIHYEFVVSSVRGAYLFGFTGRKKFVLKKSQGMLVAPVIHYALHSNSTGFNSGYLNSTLQTDFFKNIAPGDTVTMVESMILYEQY